MLLLFSLTNKDNKPLKMRINPNNTDMAICCYSSCGPSFGRDLYIANNVNTTMKSYSKLGSIYQHPQYAYGTIEALRFLAGYI